jgi:hypothetical protein
VGQPVVFCDENGAVLLGMPPVCNVTSQGPLCFVSYAYMMNIVHTVGLKISQPSSQYELASLPVCLLFPGTWRHLRCRRCHALDTES